MKPRPSRSRRFALESLEQRCVLAAEVQLLGDFNPQVDSTISSGPSALLAIGDTLYFTASRPGNGNEGSELWKTDGTTAGTQLVREIRPGTNGSGISNPVDVGGTLYFTANDGVHGPELWKSDGTAAGTVLVKDIDPNQGDDRYVYPNPPAELTNVAGTLFFVAPDPATGRNELWRTDGTESGTVVVDDAPNTPVDLTEVNGKLYFRTSLGELWVSDGTAEGTQPFGPAIGEVQELANWGGTLAFATEINDVVELWTTDGSQAGTQQVRELGSAVPELDGVQVSGVQYFVADFANKGNELWRSDGTEAGTFQVKDVRSGALGSNPLNLRNLNGTLMFTADDGEVGRELWKSDGTEEGTVLVEDIFAGPSSTGMSGGPVVFEDRLFFGASISNLNFELWVSNGTPQGTKRLVDINPGLASSSPSGLAVLGDQLLFGATTPAAGHELFTTDGTAEGTQLLVDLAQPGMGSAPSEPIVVNGKAYFTLDDGVHGRELWSNNGTPDGTALVIDLREGSEGSDPDHLTHVNGFFYFVADNGTSGRALWKSNGTAAGTMLVKPVDGPGDPKDLVSHNGNLYFTATDPVHGRELWRSNGTAGGTRMVRDIHHGDADSNPQYFTRANGQLFFAAANARNGQELWVTDGTGAGTTLVADINPGGDSSNPRSFFDHNGTLLFAASDGVIGHELWQSDGTAAGTELVKDIHTGSGLSSSSPHNFAQVGNLVFFAASTEVGTELWKTDGTAAGTVLVKDIDPGGISSRRVDSSSPSNLVNFNGMLYFSASTRDVIFGSKHPDNAGRELWKSDGTAEGTVLVADIDSTGRYGYYGFYPNSSEPANLTVVNGTLYFTAHNPDFGVNVFASDGTAEGTRVLDESLRGARSGESWIADANGALLFSIPEFIFGQEIWRYTNDAWQLNVAGKSAYTENDRLTRIAPEATFAETSPESFAGARLVVSIVRNPTAADRLHVAHSGNAAGRIGVGGVLVSYGGTPIGTLSGGTGRTPLVVTLNANATAEAVEALLRAVAFRVASENPATATRRIAFTLVDAAGAASPTSFATMTVAAVNDAPVLGDIAGSVGYTRGAAAIALAGSATVSDPDSANFAGGKLIVRITSGFHAANRLTIGGAFTVSEGNVQRNGVTIGTLNANGGEGFTRLEVTFSASATRALVQQLVRAIRFRTEGPTNTADRAVEFWLSDGDGGVSVPRTKTVTVR